MLGRTASVLLASSVIIVAACATTSTRFNSTWKAPDAGPVDFAGKKVVALVLSKNEGMRRAAEDALARELTARGAQGIAAYTLISSADVQNREKAKAQLQQAGVEGVVAMRVVDQQQQVTYVPGTVWASPYYGSFWGYYDWGWGTVYDPGYLTTDTIVSVETLVYSVPQNKLIWAGVSETTNPSKVDPFIRELVNEAAKEMAEQGLVRSTAG
jgi:hypothetical protein